MSINIYGTIYSIPDWVVLIVAVVVVWLLLTYRKSIQEFMPEALSWLLILVIVGAAIWYFVPSGISRISGLW